MIVRTPHSNDYPEATLHMFVTFEGLCLAVLYDVYFLQTGASSAQCTKNRVELQNCSILGCLVMSINNTSGSGVSNNNEDY